MEKDTVIGSLGKQSLKVRFGSQISGSDEVTRDFGNEDNWSTTSTATDSPESKKHASLQYGTKFDDLKKSEKHSIEAQLQHKKQMRLDAEHKVAKLRMRRHFDANRLMELEQRNTALERQSRVDANRISGLEETVARHEKLHAELTDKLNKTEKEKKAAEKAAERYLKQKDKPTFLFL